MSLQDFKETRDENAYLCYKCEKLLNLLNDSRKLLEDVAKKVSSLQRVERQSASNAPSAKRACTVQVRSRMFPHYPPQLAMSRGARLWPSDMPPQHPPQPPMSGGISLLPQLHEPSDTPPRLPPQPPTSGGARLLQERPLGIPLSLPRAEELHCCRIKPVKGLRPRHTYTPSLIYFTR